jgi:hypothetical protein
MLNFDRIALDWTGANPEATLAANSTEKTAANFMIPLVLR